MLGVVGSVELLLGNNVILGSQLVELSVFELFVGVLHRNESLLRRRDFVCLLLEHESFLGKLALELGLLRIEPVVEGHLFAKVGVLPKAEGTRTDKGSALEQTHLLVEGELGLSADEADLPELQGDRDREQKPHLPLILGVRGILAEVFVLAGVIRGVVEPQIVHILHQVSHPLTLSIKQINNY